MKVVLRRRVNSMRAEGDGRPTKGMTFHCEGDGRLTVVFTRPRCAKTRARPAPTGLARGGIRSADARMP